MTRKILLAVGAVVVIVAALGFYLGAPQSILPEKFHAFRQMRLANAAAQVAKQT